MSIFDNQGPLTSPAPMLTQSQPSADQRVQMLARMLASRKADPQAGVLGGLDQVAKAGLSGLMMSKGGQSSAVAPPPTQSFGNSGFGDQSDAFGSSGLGPEGATSYDPGMSLPGNGGFGAEMPSTTLTGSVGSPPPSTDSAKSPLGGYSYNAMDGVGEPQPGMSMIDPLHSVYEQTFGQQGATMIDPVGSMISKATGGGAKIICTELHRQGLMSDKIYAADQIFGEIMACNHPEVMRGYHRLASPVVTAMRKSPAFSRVMAAIVAPWARHMAFLVDADDKGSILGMLMMMAGLFVCRMFGGATPVPAEA